MGSESDDEQLGLFSGLATPEESASDGMVFGGGFGGQ
jgi:hypothetical protein